MPRGPFPLLDRVWCLIHRDSGPFVTIVRLTIGDARAYGRLPVATLIETQKSHGPLTQAHLSFGKRSPERSVLRPCGVTPLMHDYCESVTTMTRQMVSTARTRGLLTSQENRWPGGRAAPPC